METRVKGSGKGRRVQLGNVDHVSLEDARQEARKLLMEAKRGTDIRFKQEDGETVPETLGAALEEFYAARASNRMHPRLARSLVVGRQTCHHAKIPIQSLDNDFGRFRLYIQRKRSERSHKVRSRRNKKLLLEVIGKSL